MEHCAYLPKALVSAFCSQNPRFCSQSVKNSLFVSYFSNIFVPFTLGGSRLRLRKAKIYLVFHSICTTFAGANEEYDNESCSFRPGRRGI